MANPLFDLFGGAPRQDSMADAMSQLRADPIGMIRNRGFSIPDELAGNPQAAVMHLIQTGQVGGPLMQRIQPLLNMMRR